jgi:hypothetical protein
MCLKGNKMKILESDAFQPDAACRLRTRTCLARRLASTVLLALLSQTQNPMIISGDWVAMLFILQ